MQVEYTHPALGGCFGPGCHISFGTDLVGDDYTGYNDPVPDNYPNDCNGHGTHVTGIIGALPNPMDIVGVAPEATLGMYRVFGCEAGASDEIMAAAFSQAFEDGADIITASVGGASGWSDGPWSLVVDRIVEHGVLCTLANGNDGELGLFYDVEAAGAKEATAVASFNNYIAIQQLVDSYAEIDGANRLEFGYRFTLGLPDWPGEAFPLYALSLNTSVVDDACSPLPDDTPDLSRYAVLIRGGGCHYVDKARAAMAKGAKYIIFYNNEPGADTVNVWALRDRLGGAGMIPPETGATFVEALKAGHKVAVMMGNASAPEEPSFLYTYNNTLSGGAVSSFTSWGPTFEAEMKPQVGAPGADILSTWLDGTYVPQSGTSMATPFLAAAIALIAQVRGTRDPKTLNQLVSTTAKPQTWNVWSQWFPGTLAPVSQQGAGIVQAYDAAFTTTFLEPKELSFSDMDHFPEELPFVLSNKGAQPVSYNISYVPAVSMYALKNDHLSSPHRPNEIFDGSATLTFSETRVALDPGHRNTISVRAQQPQGVDARRLPIWSGYIAIYGTDGSSLSMPYQGIAGSLYHTVILAPNQTSVGLYNADGDFIPVPANSTVILPPQGKPSDIDTWLQLEVIKALSTRELRADVVPLTTCPPANLTVDDPIGGGFKTIGQIHGYPKIKDSRNNGFIRSWDGFLSSEVYAPPGKYKIVMRALSLFGDRAKLSDWQMTETQPFYIKYQT